jgi:hypothetical protein
MEDKDLDKAIKKAFGKRKFKIDMSKNVMRRIEAYELKKSGKSLIIENIISMFVLILSAVSLAVFDIVFVKLKYLFVIYEINFDIVRIVFFLFFGMIMLSVITFVIVVNYPRNKAFSLYSI